MTKVNLAVIGTGRIGRMHIDNITGLREIYQIGAISDLFDPKLADLAKEYNIPFSSSSYQEAIDQPGIDAVVIASSTDTHEEIIEYAAKKGKAIFCEKPIATDIDGIKRVLKLVEECKVKLQVGFNRRFDHNFHKIYETVKSGAIGDPQIIKVTSRDPKPPTIDYVKVSGGLFQDMMIHDFDIVRFLSMSEVVEVHATGAVLIDPEIGKEGDIDTAIVTLKFANGALGVIDNSRQAVYGYDQRAEVFGSKGQVFSTNDQLSNIHIDVEEGSKGSKIPYFFTERYSQAYIDEFKEFYEVVKNNKEPLVTGIDGLRSVEIAQACLKSLKEQKSVKL
ncbi:inositol 2-dehydrogenase [Enterococcus sp. AZ109]|uniref:inositol 2-dehydrogenase n=1 Tax=Enterococcus sp. AZ109 TaxID=2774634 RepID=UPI003F1EF3CE